MFLSSSGDDDDRNDGSIHDLDHAPTLLSERRRAHAAAQRDNNHIGNGSFQRENSSSSLRLVSPIRPLTRHLNTMASSGHGSAVTERIDNRSRLLSCSTTHSGQSWSPVPCHPTTKTTTMITTNKKTTKATRSVTFAGGAGTTAMTTTIPTLSPTYQLSPQRKYEVALGAPEQSPNPANSSVSNNFKLYHQPVTPSPPPPQTPSPKHTSNPRAHVQPVQGANAHQHPIHLSPPFSDSDEQNNHNHNNYHAELSDPYLDDSDCLYGYGDDEPCARQELPKRTLRLQSTTTTAISAPPQPTSPQHPPQIPFNNSSSSSSHNLNNNHHYEASDPYLQDGSDNLYGYGDDEPLHPHPPPPPQQEAAKPYLQEANYGYGYDDEPQQQQHPQQQQQQQDGEPKGGVYRSEDFSCSSSSEEEQHWKSEYEGDEEETAHIDEDSDGLGGVAVSSSHNNNNKKKNLDKSFSLQSFKRWISNWPLTKLVPKVDQIAIFVVRYAPCFICCGFKTPTNRSILKRLNMILGLASLYPIFATLYLVIVLHGPALLDRTIPPQLLPVGAEAPDGHSTLALGTAELWNLNGTHIIMGITSLVIFITTIFTWRVVRDVNLVGAIRYLWVIWFSLVFLIFCTIGLFDYFRVTNIYVKHWWRDEELAWFRQSNCPRETYNTLCTVPLLENETEWCLLNYNSTDCSAIRNQAQEKTIQSLLTLYYFTAVWGVLLIFMSVLMADTLERMISKPLVAKARTSSIAFLLFLPIMCCITLGCVFAFAQQSLFRIDSNLKLDWDWVGPFFIAVGILYLCVAFLGSYISNNSILSGSDKRRKLLAVLVFIVLMLVASGMLLILFAIALSFCGEILQEPLGDLRGNLACVLDKGTSCTRCDQETDQCPEWSEEDITLVLQEQGKMIATVAAIFLVYSFAATKIGFTMRKHIAMYQIEYV